MAQWDAFISYARSASTLEAQKLQTAIQTFAKPWYRLRAVRIFRDDSSMSASPALWSSIEQGLQQARWLVVLLSRAAARSEYVAAEIRWWLQHKDASTILLVHDDGVLGWDRRRNDFAAEADCVPAPLRGAFREEPRWTDLSWFDDPGSSGAADPRFAEKVADLAATVRGIPRDELLGEDVAQHKRSWRLARTAIGLLSLLLIASVVASIIAIAQRNEVQRQANALLARQLAATADSLLTRDLRRAQLLAVQAYRTDPTPDTRAALLRATLASPALRRFVPFSADISALSASADGRFVVVGLENGEVHSWDVAGATVLARLRLPQPISDVGISNDGAVVAAVDGTTSQVATGTTVGTLVTPAGERPNVVAVSPSGVGLVIGSSSSDDAHLTLVDLATRSQRTVADASSFGSFALQFVGEQKIVLVGGQIETRTFPGFVLLTHADSSYGARQIAGRISADGRFNTATNGASEVPVWPVSVSQDDDPLRYAFVPMSNETASALNGDGSKLVVADATGLHVATVRSTRAPAGYGHSAAPPTTFVGIPKINDRGVVFLGPSSRFVAAAGSELSLWDPDSAGRSATTGALAIKMSCTACGSPSVVLSPDGSTMAVRDGERSSLLVGSVPGRSGSLTAQLLPNDADAGELAAPLWLDDATVLQIAQGSTDGTVTGAIPGLQPGLVGWVTGRPDVRILTGRLTTDGSTTTVVDAAGRIARYQPRTGALISETPSTHPDNDLFDAAISEDGTEVATVGYEEADRGVTVRNADTGNQLFRVDTDQESASRVLFASGSLWVRYLSGLIERRDPATGALQRRLPGRLTGTGDMFEASGLVAIPIDLGVALYDAPSDVLLGAVPFPANWQSTRRGVGLAPDASVLVSAFEPLDNGQGLAVATQLAPEALVASACRTSGGSLTPDDWRTLIGPDVPADLACK